MSGITENKEKIEALRLSEERFRLVSQVASDYAFSVLVNPDGTIEQEWVSESIERVTGYRPDQLMNGEQYVAIIYPEDRPLFFDEMRRLATGENSTAEYRIVHKDGHLVWLQSNTTPVRDQVTGCLVRNIGAMKDITARKKAEEEKRQLRQQLAHADKLASIGALASGVTHEINNPLTIIRGNIDIIERLLADAEPFKEKETILRLLQRGDSAIDRIVKIVNNLRNYSRMDSEQLEPVDLNRSVQEALHICETIYEKSNIALRIKLSQEKLIVMATNGKLQQVLINLLNNAKDAIEEGQTDGVIEVETIRLPNSVMIQVKDNGVGLTEEQIPRIFEPFYTTKSAEKGTGLGLSISQNIVRALGGKISVQSTYRLGSTFVVEIPASFKDNSTIVKSAKEVHGPIHARALVVDDEADIRMILGFLLMKIGIEVVEAEDGLDALRQLECADFDLIFTDIKMPKMSGEKLITTLQARSDFRAKIIVISGDAIWGGESGQIAEIGGQEFPFVRKPFSEEALYAILRQTLSQ